MSGGKEIPTVTDNLYSQGKISTNSIGISYAPTSDSTTTSGGTTSSGTASGGTTSGSTSGGTSNAQTGLLNGELTFGGTDSSKYSGELNMVPITTTSPASEYWGIDQSIRYGDSTTILEETAGIVDTGTTLLYLASDAFEAYEKATGGVLDQTTGLLKITEDQYNSLQSLFFTIGGTEYELTPNAQIWPRSLNSELGGNDGDIYLVAANNGTKSGSGLDFINGFVWRTFPDLLTSEALN